jgi:hypothetical protein
VSTQTIYKGQIILKNIVGRHSLATELVLSFQHSVPSLIGVSLRLLLAVPQNSGAEQYYKKS